jgi:Flp pilus assembly protein TadD
VSKIIFITVGMTSATVIALQFLIICPNTFAAATHNKLAINPTQNLPKPLDLVAKTAKRFTVLIEQPSSNGSGVIIAKSGQKYTVVTAAHVLKNSSENLTITTFDGKKHVINPKTIQIFTNKIDLAVVQFVSSQNYRVAKLGNSDLATEGTKTYLSGFSGQSTAITTSSYVFRTGSVIAKLYPPLSGGYDIVYSANTLPGMSGGGVFNARGELIAIHGRGDVDATIKQDPVNPNIRYKTGHDLGMSVKTFMRLAKGFVTLDRSLFPTATLLNDRTHPIFQSADQKLRQGDYPGAIADYTKVLEISPTQTDAYFNRGVAFWKFGQIRKAIADYNRVIEIKPMYADAYSNRAFAKEKIGDRVGANQDWRMAADLYKKQGQIKDSQAAMGKIR